MTLASAREQWMRQPRNGPQSWYRIGNYSAGGSADVWVYDEIGYWGITALDFVRELSALNATEIALHINSPGGDVFDGIAIYNAIRNHPATVTSHVDGLAASAASFIACAADRTVMQPQAQMMIHEASGLCIGPADDMRAMAELLEKTSGSLADIYATTRGGTAEAWRAAMQAESWYTAEEAVAAGLAHEVAADRVSDPADPASAAAMATRFDTSRFTYANRAAAPAPILPAAESAAFTNYGSALRAYRTTRKGVPA